MFLGPTAPVLARRALDPSSSPTSSALDGVATSILFPTPSSAAAAYVDIARAAPCCGAAVIQVHTTFTVPNFNRYYDAPLPSIGHPDYVTRGDGSLLAPPIIQDARLAAASLVVTGAYLLLFVRNIVVSFGYIRRMKVKNKELFYILFASQVLALFVWGTFLIGVFNLSVDCETITRTLGFLSSVSSGMLLTGVYGLKAWRCMNKSVLVLIVLGSLRLANFILVIIDMVTQRADRRLVGGCTRVDSATLLMTIMILVALEATFIFSCFMYTVWKASRLLAAKGCISYRSPSDPDLSSSRGDKRASHTLRIPSPRGWWDYVARSSPASPATGNQSSTWPYLDGLRNCYRNMFISNPSPTPPVMRKSSIPGDQPLSQPPRLRLATQDIERLSTVPPNRYQEANLDLPAPPFSSLKPRMILFREVMRDEAGYSAFISATCAISAVLGFVAIKRQILWAPTGWLGINWALMSALAVHSFGRVVHRHEEEAMFRNPAYWDPMLNTDLETSRTFQLIDPRRAPSFMGGPHRRPVRHVDSFDSGTYTFPDSYKFGEGSYQSYRVDHSIPPEANDRQSWEESSSSEPREKERNRTSSYASPYPSPLGTVVHEDASHGWSRDVPIGLVAMETRTDESNALDTSTSSGHADSIPDYCIPSPQRNLPDR